MTLRRIFAFALLTMLVFMRLQSAVAQDIETLVMPGDVIDGHAEFESDCSSCHKLFDKQGQRQRCLDCHEEVSADVTQETGFHGRHPDVATNQCSSCHTEHTGRDANIVILDEEAFDHDFTDFELVGTHNDADCADCHAADEKRREARTECVTCHTDEQPHEDKMGTDCGNCHQPTEWLEAKFDHDTTEYSLLGKHQQVACLDCHEDRTFPKPLSECIDCHAEDDAHNGRSGDQCGNCHNPSDWHDSSFDHFRDTDFELLGRHAELTCDDCHTSAPFEDDLDKTCISCHSDDDEHDRHNGEECDSCHSNSSWSEPTFDHSTDTDYDLLGGHVDIACNDCHVEPIFEVALDTTCRSCHLEDDIHEEFLGSQCEGCHTEVNWQDPVFFDHDLSSFPLLGAHNENECEDCHATQLFKDIENTCSSCHTEDDPHRGNFTGSCDSCHNPVAWELWVFDHDTQTDFALVGAHIRVACNDCHRSELNKMKAIDNNCGSCHRADDIHDNEFGGDCGRCHSANSFEVVRTLQ
jgi:predicted CXXCH cytochrome family protein